MSGDCARSEDDRALLLDEDAVVHVSGDLALLDRPGRSAVDHTRLRVSRDRRPIQIKRGRFGKDAMALVVADSPLHCKFGPVDVDPTISVSGDHGRLCRVVERNDRLVAYVKPVAEILLDCGAADFECSSLDRDTTLAIVSDRAFLDYRLHLCGVGRITD